MYQDEKAIAEYYCVSERLVPHLPILFNEFTDLGSNTRRIVDWIKELNLPEKSTILDAGSGKADIALAIADNTDYCVLGLDFFLPFIEYSNNQAESRGLSDRCKFEPADLKSLPIRNDKFDLAMFLSVGSELFGGLEGTVKALRSRVKPGGFIIIDDGFVQEENNKAISRADLLQKSREALTTFGDSIVEEHIISLDEIREMNDDYNGKLERSAAKILEIDPSLENDLQKYLEHERKECHLLETKYVCITWLLKRTDD